MRAQRINLVDISRSASEKSGLRTIDGHSGVANEISVCKQKTASAMPKRFSIISTLITPKYKEHDTRSATTCLPRRRS